MKTNNATDTSASVVDSIALLSEVLHWMKTDFPTFYYIKMRKGINTLVRAQRYRAPDHAWMQMVNFLCRWYFQAY